MSPLRIARLALSLLLVSLLASACLRLSTPDSFACDQASDCLADERCSRGHECAPKGTCDYLTDCSAREVCTNGKCTAAECYEGSDAACGKFNCTPGRTCNVACDGDYQCKEAYVCRASDCVPAPNLKNGASCAYNSDCSSKACCGPSMALVCRTQCLPIDAVCSSADDCESGNCCLTQGRGARCQSTACSPQPLGGPCSLPADCQTGLCVGSTCVKKTCEVDTECGAGFCDGGFCNTVLHPPGAACKTDAWCNKSTCEAGVCRGEVGSGGVCKIDSDCKVRRICCPSLTGAMPTCSAVDEGCKGANGYNCAQSGNSQCLSDMCQNLAMCTDSCALDGECGVSPWGTQNSCKKNGLGKLICFPGCTTQAQCDNNLGAQFDCTNGVCAETDFGPAGLQLW